MAHLSLILIDRYPFYYVQGCPILILNYPLITQITPSLYAAQRRPKLRFVQKDTRVQVVSERYLPYYGLSQFLK